MKITSLLISSIFLYLFITGVAQADESLSADDIVIQSLDTFKGDDAVDEAEFSTFIKQENRTETVRMFRLWKAYHGKDDLHAKMVFYNTFPVSNKATVLVWAYRSDEAKHKRWLHLPMFNETISLNDMEEPAIPGGGDPYFYSSVLQARILVPRKADLDINTIERSEVLNGVNTYVIKRTPKVKTPKDIYDYTLTWIEKDTFLPVKTVFLTADTAVIVRETQWHQLQNEWVWKKVVATDLRTGDRTTLTFKNARINVGLDDSLFTPQALKRLPTEWR